MASQRIGRLERPALMGVLVREIINFSSFWRSSTFSATVEPTVYLLAFGFGFGSLVSTVGGYDYVDYVGTGTVATAVLFSQRLPGHVRDVRQVQVPAHLRRDPRRAGGHRGARHRRGAVDRASAPATYGCAPMLVAMLFGLDPSFGMLLVPFIGFIAGFGWANFGIGVAARMNSIDNFSYVISAVLTPLFLSPARSSRSTACPSGRRSRRSSTRSTTSSSSSAHAVFGFEPGADLVHLAVLVGFGLLTWRLAIRWMTKRLID